MKSVPMTLHYRSPAHHVEGGFWAEISTAGRWTPGGYIQDPVMNPAIAKGDPGSTADKNPERAGKRSELGAYGNSGEASYVR